MNLLDYEVLSAEHARRVEDPYAAPAAGGAYVHGAAGGSAVATQAAMALTLGQAGREGPGPGQAVRERPGIDGMLAMAPFVLAYAPFALVIGSTVARVDPPLAGWAGSWLIYGGSAHLAALRGVADGNALLAVLTGLLVNVRLLVYGVSVAPRWAEQPRWFRAAGAALLIDPTWALADRHAGPAPSLAAQRRFFLAAGLTLGLGWSAMIAAGALAGDRLPSVGLRHSRRRCA